MSAATSPIVDEVVIFDHPSVGRIAAVLPVIPEDAPYRIREGIARRRIVITTGVCPCGALADLQLMLDDASTGRPVGAGEVVHERGCPADTATLVKAIRRWKR